MDSRPTVIGRELQVAADPVELRNRQYSLDERRKHQRDLHTAGLRISMMRTPIAILQSGIFFLCELGIPENVSSF